MATLSVEEKLEQSLECTKCEHTICGSRQIAAAGTGLSKILDIQHNHFIALCCQECGLTELFDPNVLTRSLADLSRRRPRSAGNASSRDGLRVPGLRGPILADSGLNHL